MFASPRQPQAVPLIRLRGTLPLGRRSNPSQTGARIRAWPGAFRHLVGKVSIRLDHARLLTRGEVREAGGSLVVDFTLDPLDKAHAPIVESILRGDAWGISPAFRALIDTRNAGDDVWVDVLRVDALHEVSLSRNPAFASSVSCLKMENR